MHPLRAALHAHIGEHNECNTMPAPVLVMHWRSRTGQMIYLIYFKKYWVDHVMANELEISPLQQMCNIFPCPRKEVVDANDLHGRQNVHDAHSPGRGRHERGQSAARYE